MSTVEAPSWMDEPVVCKFCNEWKELVECGKCDLCNTMACNSCTYSDASGIYYCVDCWEEKKDE